MAVVGYGALMTQTSRRGPVIIGVAAVGVVIAGVAAYAGITVAQHDQRAAVPSASTATFSPSMTCGDLMPLLGQVSDGVERVTATPDQIPDSLQATATGLRKTAITAPADWRADIATQYEFIEHLIATGGKSAKVADVLKTIPAWSEAFVRLTDRCKPYYS